MKKKPGVLKLEAMALMLRSQAWLLGSAVSDTRMLSSEAQKMMGDLNMKAAELELAAGEQGSGQ